MRRMETHGEKAPYVKVDSPIQSDRPRWFATDIWFPRKRILFLFAINSRKPSTAAMLQRFLGVTSIICGIFRRCDAIVKWDGASPRSTK